MIRILAMTLEKFEVFRLEVSKSAERIFFRISLEMLPTKQLYFEICEKNFTKVWLKRHLLCREKNKQKDKI